MSEYLYSKKVDAGASRCDVNGSWMLSTVLEAMQDIANEHCKFLHVGHDDLALKNLTWVLFKIDLRIVRYPKLGEQVTVKTFTKGSNFKFFPRYYTIEDENGSQICKAGALWMLMEKESRSAVTSRESGIELPNEKEIETPIRISTKSKDIDGEVIVYPYTPLYTDIDFNGHLNNIRYADWLCNSLGVKKLTEHEISFISIDYNYEVPLDIGLETRLICKDDEIQFIGVVGEKCYFRIYGTVRERI